MPLSTCWRAEALRHRLVVRQPVEGERPRPVQLHQIEGGELPAPRFSPPAIADFRVVVPEAALEPSLRGVVHDMLRVYNAPDARLLRPGAPFAHLASDEGFAAECMGGLARVGVMRIRPPPSTAAGVAHVAQEELGQIGIWGDPAGLKLHPLAWRPARPPPQP